MSRVIVAPIEVLTDSRISDTERRVLLALYSFQGRDDGVWPSTEKLAELAQITDVPRISKLTKSLAEKGWLSKRKKGFTGCNIYTLTVPEIDDTKMEDIANLANFTKLEESTNTNLANFAKCKEQTIEQTNINIAKPKKTSGKKTSGEKIFTDWLQEIHAQGEQAIQDSDPILDYPNEIGMSDEFLRVAWFAFKTAYADKPKKYTDWRSVFRRYVRENWGKLWWFDGVQYALTTVGHQARNELENKSRQVAT